jgi:hypothetical protein
MTTQSPISSASALRRPSVPPELLILLAAFLLLVIGAGISLALQLRAPDGPPLSTRAYGVTGSVALARWAEALGYQVKSVESRPYRIPQDVQVLFVLQPAAQYAFSQAETDELLRWVRGGGTLVVALEASVFYPVTRRGPVQFANGDQALLDAFDIKLDRGARTYTLTVAMQQPLFMQRASEDFEAPVRDSLKIPDDAVALAGARGDVVLASRRIGDGRVIVSSLTYPFTNEGLRDDGNAMLALNLLRLAPAGGTIEFDEYHHGVRQTASIFAWLVSAPAGQGVLLALACLAVFILWTGRRMGRPFTPPELRIRRQPGEYVLAMANLARAAGQRDAALLRYHDWLKRKLGRPRRVDPQLSDEQFVAELCAVDPGVDGERLRKLLRELSAKGHISAERFVRLAREASEFEV